MLGLPHHNEGFQAPLFGIHRESYLADNLHLFLKQCRSHPVCHCHCSQCRIDQERHCYCSHCLQAGNCRAEDSRRNREQIPMLWRSRQVSGLHRNHLRQSWQGEALQSESRHRCGLHQPSLVESGCSSQLRWCGRQSTVVHCC